MLAAQQLSSGIVDFKIPEALHTEGGYRPEWLQSPYESPEWKVSNTGDKNPKIIVFDVMVPGGGRMSDYPNLYNSIKRVAYGVRTGPLATIESADVQVGVVNNLTTLASWMITNDITQFSQLTKADREAYAKEAVYGLHNILNAESILERHLEHLIEKANFHPDDDQEIRRKKALNVFTTRRTGANNFLTLHRTKILHDAGLDQVGLSGKNSILATLLDEAEAMCGFYQTASAKARAEKSRDDTDDRAVSEEHLRRFLMSLQYLYEHRRFLEDAPAINPFQFTSPRAEARKLGSEIGRTDTVPVKQATHLIERSVRWVLDYAPKILALKEWMDGNIVADPEVFHNRYKEHLASISDWPQGPASPFPILTYLRSDGYQDEQYRAETLRGGMSLHSAVFCLMTACGVVIAAFTARRAAEIGGLKTGSISTDESGQLWLKCFIHKTLRVESQIPIPEVVSAAVKVLEDLSARARYITGTSYIFQYNIPGSDRTCGLSREKLPNFSFGRHLRRFGYFVDVPRLEDGTPWTFKPHQFRRFFAILYIWVYDKGDWGALQYHLRHFGSEMTRRYVTENEVGQVIAQADKEHTAEILANATLGITYIGGNEGVRLKTSAQKIHSRMVKSLEVVSERKYKQKLERFVERTGISLVGFPWGYCVKRETQESRFCNCTNTGLPDPEKASEITCMGCAFSMVTPAAANFLSTAIQFHRDVVESPDTPEILLRASQAIEVKLSIALAEITPPSTLGGGG